MDMQTNLLPLSVRGINYYPKDAPWGGTWNGQTSPAVWDQDMARAASLRINCVRTFIDSWPVASSGAFDAIYLDRLDSFLEIASSHGIRVVLCGPFNVWNETTTASLVTPHKDDGRILMWDMVNEPKTLMVNEHEPFFDDSISDAINRVKLLDPSHFTTVGLQWEIEALAKAGSLPDVIQYHEFAQDILWQGYERVTAVIERMQETDRIKREEQMQSVGGPRPVLIGECGQSTLDSPEWEQALLYQYVFTACEKSKLPESCPGAY